MSKKIAVILCNLGGPSSLKEVKSFLFNLFYDKAIINLPNPFRFFIAKLISTLREKKAQEIYSFIGGKSPILENTLNQARSLEKELGKDYKTYVVMRNSSPRATEIIAEIEKENFEQIIILPLYPQLSATTSVSSVNEIKNIIKDKRKLKTICCYPENEGFVDANIDLIKQKIDQNFLNEYRILFSAHGLPEKNIKDGDPYQFQVEKTAHKILKKLGFQVDYKICYQSKVGPMKWIGPATDDEIIAASKLKKRIVLVPLSFVSEHSETLVELDIEYKEIADKFKCKEYIRIPTVGTHPKFINGLADIVKKIKVKQNSNKDLLVTNFDDKKYCPNKFCKCIFNN